MIHRPSRITVTIALSTGVLLAGAVGAAPADAAPVGHHTAPASASGLHGYTVVRTAKGIASTLIGAGIVPKPVPPNTGYRTTGSGDALQAIYTFPVKGGNVNLAKGTGNIFHKGGVNFAGHGTHLALTRFDIDIAAGKIYANRVDFKKAHVPVFDLNLSSATVMMYGGKVVVKHVGLLLDPVAAGALNDTFGLQLPTDGSLRFGTAKVILD